MSRTGVKPEVLQQILNQQQRMIAENYVRTEELVVINRLNATFTESRAYSNVIMIVGYAGFFTLLNLSENKIPLAAQDFAIVLFIISLTAFIFNEIFNMVVNMNSTALLAAKAMDLSDLRIRAPLVATDQLVSAAKEISARGIRVETGETPLKNIPVWRVCFPISLVSGYVAAIVLVLTYVYRLWQAV